MLKAQYNMINPQYKGLETCEVYSQKTHENARARKNMRTPLPANLALTDQSPRKVAVSVAFTI